MNELGLKGLHMENLESVSDLKNDTIFPLLSEVEWERLSEVPFILETFLPVVYERILDGYKVFLPSEIYEDDYVILLKSLLKTTLYCLELDPFKKAINEAILDEETDDEYRKQNILSTTAKDLFVRQKVSAFLPAVHNKENLLYLYKFCPNSTLTFQQIYHIVLDLEKLNAWNRYIHENPGEIIDLDNLNSYVARKAQALRSTAKKKNGKAERKIKGSKRIKTSRIDPMISERGVKRDPFANTTLFERGYVHFILPDNRNVFPISTYYFSLAWDIFNSEKKSDNKSIHTVLKKIFTDYSFDKWFKSIDEYEKTSIRQPDRNTVLAMVVFCNNLKILLSNKQLKE